MSLPQSTSIYSIAEYLARERLSEERHEYIDGRIYAMAGESEAHGDICVNLVREMSVQLREKPCRVWTKDTKVRSGPTPKTRQASRGLFSYPDVVVVCGERQYHDDYKDVQLNPSVIIEVLSPATEGYDRGEKWERYRTWVPSLMDYLLVSQTKPLIEHYIRQRNGEWLYSPVSGLTENLSFAAIDCSLQLSEVYDRVVFPPEPAEGSDAE